MTKKNKPRTNKQKQETTQPETPTSFYDVYVEANGKPPEDQATIDLIKGADICLERMITAQKDAVYYYQCWQREKKDGDQMEEMIKMMSKNVQMMQNNILEAQEVNQKLYTSNVELGKQNEDFLKERNDVIRKYNLYIQFQKMIPEEELKAWTQKLPENSKNKFHFNAKDYEMTSEVLESGNVKYVISKIKKELPSGKEVELVDVIDKEKH
jgi:hypothetical protein